VPWLSGGAPRPLLAAALLACGVAAWAHDSWLQPAQAQPGSGLVALELGNGARYPRSEGTTPAPRLAQSGCSAEGGDDKPLQPRGEQPAWLELRSRIGAARAVACWVELKPQEIALTPALAQAYLDDIRAPDAVRAAWSGRQRAGGGWREVYRKFVRIELPAPQGREVVDLAALRRPRAFALELVPAGGRPLRAGEESEFLVLSGGRPAAGLPVEFVSRRSPLGIWRTSDAEGRVRLVLPFGGEWLLRTTVIDVPAAESEPWHSRYASLTVAVR
jgi:hypothetical protein